MKRRTALSLAIWVLAVIGAAALNLAGAWYGGSANLSSLAATIGYLCATTGFLILGRANSIGSRLGFLWSLLSFLSAFWSLIMRLAHSGFIISAIFSLLSAVPFYGLRHWLDWTATYALATGVSLMWLVLTAGKRKTIMQSK